MPKFIKSHSNYVLSKKHQEVTDGTIWERDITTIGGVNQFAKGQIPIFKDNNFIITVRDDGKVANQYNQTKWKANESGDTWTLETISGMTSELEDQNDLKIVLKQDYYDFCDFAYYGSLTEMFRASINDVLQRFPGELYLTSDVNVYRTSSYTEDFEVYNDDVLLGGSRYTLVSNPFGIDVHSAKRPSDGKEIKYFADGGYENYRIGIGNSSGACNEESIVWEYITDWKVDYYDPCLRCTCEDLVVKGDLTIDSSGGTNILIGTYNENTCLTRLSGNSHDNWVSDITLSNGEIRANIPSYRGTKNDRDSRITISGYIGTEICTKSFIVTQKRRSCDCDDLEITPKFSSTRSRGLMASSPSSLRASGAQEDPSELYRRIAKVTLNNRYVIYAYLGDNDEIVYLVKNNDKSIHIRPKEDFITEFYNNCDNFEKLIMNNKTTPLYKAMFSVIKENENGYYREMEDFTFPTSYGGYNIDATAFKFNEYTTRLAEIGEYYDSLFSDNLWRSMTHEAIKNFDWTYTREFYQGDEEEYVHGGEKIQKALRIFAREFDEILTYINNIKNIGRLTYDERNNVPDYFLIDEVENKGWDVCLVYPYDLKYYVRDESGKTSGADEYSESENLNNLTNNEKHLIREFSQNTKNVVYPYSSKMAKDYPYGYFVVCNCDGQSGSNNDCRYSKGSNFSIHEITEEENCSGITYYVDECTNSINNRIKTFTDERPYTYMDANNEFLRRLAINSPYIFNHKGTVEGIEMILGMFGLKSKRWVDRMPSYRQNCEQYSYNYEITEYSSFTNRIEERWDAVHQMYRIDWINSTKTIVYDYRSTSNYTKYGAQPNYISYQGLPIAFRDEYLSADEPYIKVSPLLTDSGQTPTSNYDEAFKRIDENNTAVRRRYLYPNFNKYEQIDGDPYFQMDGGWLAKTVESNGRKYNFQFDVDDNIAYTPYVFSGSTSDSGVTDNDALYKETVRNIKRVDTIDDLIATPIDSVKDGSIIYVSNVDKDIAVIDNEVFKIKYEHNPNPEIYGDGPLRYVSLIAEDGFISIGDSKYFDSTIMVYGRNEESGLVESLYSLEDKENGYEVKAYIKKGDDNKSTFICQANSSGAYTIDSFVIPQEIASSTTTNYFIIDNAYYANRLADENGVGGWRRLDENDAEYIRINTIKNYYEGNNAHNGNMRYDSGHDYFTYFKRLFKHAIDNELFDERCYEAYYYDLDNEISLYGFDNLIEDNETIKQYQPFLIKDSKIHYFGNYFKRYKDGLDVTFYGENQEKKENLNIMYNSTFNNYGGINDYILNEDDKMIGGSPYSGQSGYIDEVTNQVLNNKRFTIKFYLHNDWYTNKGQSELKYLDSIVMNYLTQMIPSTTIVDIQYTYNPNHY